MISSRRGRIILAIAAVATALLVTPVAADPPPDSQTEFLLIDEDTIDSDTTGIERISFNPPFCGGRARGPGEPSKCINDDRADPGVRDVLFTRPRDITPLTDLTLPTGQVEDEGLFRFTRTDQQTSLQNDAKFTVAEFFSATGAAADESNLDKIAGVVPLGEADINGLVGKTVCAVVYDSDISVDVKDGYGNLQGATLGVTAFTVTAVSRDASDEDSLPMLIVDLLPSAEVGVACEPSTEIPEE